LDAPGAVCAAHAGPHPTLRAAARSGVMTQPPALLLLHYFGGSARSWNALAARLGPKRRCVAPDMRGFGANHPGGPYALGDYADDAAALATGLGPFLLVGHSMGAKVAVALAARRPPGLVGVVLVAPFPALPRTYDGRRPRVPARLVRQPGRRGANRSRHLRQGRGRTRVRPGGVRADRRRPHARGGTVRSRWCAIRTACPWLRRSGDASDLGPNLKGLGPGGSILGGWNVVAAEVEEVADPVVGGEEALCLAG